MQEKIEGLLTMDNITTTICVSLFLTLCYYMVIGYLVPLPPVWWNVL